MTELERAVRLQRRVTLFWVIVTMCALVFCLIGAANRPPNGSPTAVSERSEADELSEREVDVLRLLTQGASNREIADRLVLAEGTVKKHVSNILTKLHAANRTHAANLARERGLI